jgi:hypothetical protein
MVIFSNHLVSAPYLEVTDLTPATTYYFQVAAVAVCGSGLPSPRSGGVTTTAIPSRTDWNVPVVMLASTVVFLMLLVLASTCWKAQKYNRDWVVRGESENPLSMPLMAVERRAGLLCVYDYQQDLLPEKRLGEGHFGTVLLATLRRKGAQGARFVAVKRLKNDFRSATHHVSLLLEEAVTMSQIPPHKNVVRVHGICSDPPAIVMEYIEDALEADAYLLSVEWALPGLKPWIQVGGTFNAN